MIIVQNVTKVYDAEAAPFTALDDVSLKIPSGLSVAIVGKSGSGKSTLMHIMSGLDHSTSGEVIINGQNFDTMKPKQVDSFRANEMSFIFQAFFVEANQTCVQNVMLPLEIAKAPQRQRMQKVMDALEAVGLKDKAHQRAATLSGGQKQRLAVARAIVNKPKLIFADEPTGNLDSVNGSQIVSLLFDLNKKLDCTVVIVTHDAELASQCDMQITMKDGKILLVKDNRMAKKTTKSRSK